MTLQPNFEENLKKFRKNSVLILLMLKLSQQNALDYYCVHPEKQPIARRKRYRWGRRGRNASSSYFFYLSKQQSHKLAGKKRIPKRVYQKIKIGTLLRKIAKHYNRKFRDNTIEKTVNLINAITWIDNIEVEHCTGKRIKYVYNLKNYANKGKTQLSNCMKHARVLKELDFYILNNINVFAILYKNKVLARSVIWGETDLFNRKGDYLKKSKIRSPIYAVNDIWRNYTEILLKASGYIYLKYPQKAIRKLSNPILLKNMPHIDVFNYFTIAMDSISTHSDENHLIRFNTHDKAKPNIQNIDFICPYCKHESWETPNLSNAIYNIEKPPKIIGCKECTILDYRNGQIKIRRLEDMTFKNYIEMFLLHGANGLKVEDRMKQYLKQKTRKAIRHCRRLDLG